MTDERFIRHLDKYPEMKLLIASLLRFYPTDEALNEAIFRKYSPEQCREHHTLPAIDRFRINEVFVGNGEIRFYFLMTKDGSMDNMWKSTVAYKLSPGEELKFRNPTEYYHSMIVGCT